jgi:multimeric flavodoxin WrbA
MVLSDRQEALCADNTIDFGGLSALFVNTSLKRQAQESHTRLLLGVSATIMERAGVAVDHLHMLDHTVPPGVYPDMTEHGFERDDWPVLWKRVLAADILVIGTPIWLGEESSVCRVLIERLYGMSGLLNEKGQSIFYGKVGGCVIKGNEDGIKHTAMKFVLTMKAPSWPPTVRIRVDGHEKTRHSCQGGQCSGFPKRDTRLAPFVLSLGIGSEDVSGYHYQLWWCVSQTLGAVAALP